jgi:pimeloyl-ACP methyl ester carboxylesterase
LQQLLSSTEGVVVIGHSFGAVIAVEWAALQLREAAGDGSVNVDSIVLLSPSYFGSSTARVALQDANHPGAIIWKRPCITKCICVTTRFCSWLWSPLMRRIARRQLPFVPRAVVDDFMRHTYYSMHRTVLSLLDHDLNPALGAVTSHGLTVAVCGGADDTTVPPRFVFELATHFPEVTARIEPEQQHLWLLARPDLAFAFINFTLV